MRKDSLTWGDPRIFFFLHSALQAGRGPWRRPNWPRPRRPRRRPWPRPPPLPPGAPGPGGSSGRGAAPARGRASRSRPAARSSGHDRRGGPHVVGGLERDDAAERQDGRRGRGRGGASSGPPVKQWKIVRAGTPSSSRTSNVSSHASREWITSARSCSWASAIWAAEHRLLLVARRVVVVVGRSPHSPTATTCGSPSSASSAVRLAASRTASCGCSPTVAHTSAWRGGDRRPRPASVSRSVPDARPSARPRPRRASADGVASAVRRARVGEVAVAVDPASGRWRSTTSAGQPRCGGRAAAPFSTREPAGVAAPRGRGRAAAGPRARRRRPRRRHSSAAARGITGDGEQRDDAQRLEAVAEHRRRPSASPGS